MKLFVWRGKGVSGAYGKDGAFIVAANSLEEARALIRDYLESAPPLDVHTYTPEEVANGWSAVRNQATLVRERNEQRLAEHYLRKGAVVMSHGMEPPGNWEGNCYHIGWDYLQSSEPDKIVDLDKPMIVACFYGYEG